MEDQPPGHVSRVVRLSPRPKTSISGKEAARWCQTTSLNLRSTSGRSATGALVLMPRPSGCAWFKRTGPSMIRQFSRHQHAPGDGNTELQSCSSRMTRRTRDGRPRRNAKRIFGVRPNPPEFGRPSGSIRSSDYSARFIFADGPECVFGRGLGPALSNGRPL